MFTLHCEVDIESTLEYNRQESSELFEGIALLITANVQQKGAHVLC